MSENRNRHSGDDRFEGFAEESSSESDDETIREQELLLDEVDALAEEGVTVAELAEGVQSWQFGHVIVDEAQDLSPMQWRMVKRRCMNNAMTIVGDVAQRSLPDGKSWEELLPLAADSFRYKELTVNYRSPAEVNKIAAQLLQEINPRLQPARSIRSADCPVQFVKAATAETVKEIIQSEIAENKKGRVAVISASGLAGSDFSGVQALTPQKSKGLEFDTVIIVDVETILSLANGRSSLYVAITRSTERLTILYQDALPEFMQCEK